MGSAVTGIENEVKSEGGLMKPMQQALLILVLSLFGVAFGQSHPGHESQTQVSAESQQESQAPLRPVSELIRESGDSMRMIEQAARKQDAVLLDRAVNGYIAVLTELKTVLRQGDPKSKSFEKDLARVEKMFKTNLRALEDSRKTARGDLGTRLEDASEATGEAYRAAASLRKEIYSEEGEHQGGHGCCSHGSHDAGNSQDNQGGDHHRGWFSRWGRFFAGHHLGRFARSNGL